MRNLKSIMYRLEHATKRGPTKQGSYATATAASSELQHYRQCTLKRLLCNLLSLQTTGRWRPDGTNRSAYS